MLSALRGGFGGGTGEDDIVWSLLIMFCAGQNAVPLMMMTMQR